MPTPASASPSVRVLVVDDHPMVREGLRSMLGCAGVAIVGEADTGGEALRLTAELDPDVVLLDIELPDMDGIRVVERLREQGLRSVVLIVTMHDEPALVRRAVEAGAAGYVLKGVGRRELLGAVNAVRDGESVLDPSLLRSLLASLGPRPATAAPLAAASALTRIEREVLGLIAAGLTNREIAERMRWSVSTAKKYVQRILEKLMVSDRTQAAVEAVRQGLLG